MSIVDNYLITWWYSPGTKLGLYFNSFSQNASSVLLNNSLTHLNYSNGMAASLNENYSYSNLITDHPVEGSSSVSDHIISLPRRITITGAVTSLSSFLIVGNNLDFNQLGDAVKLLDGLANSKTGISLTTGLLYGSTYYRTDNMAVEKSDIIRNLQSGKTTVQFTMTLKKLNLVGPAGGTAQPSAVPSVQVSGAGNDIS